ncbi:MAG: hypothetical protein ACQ9MH_19210, partial [Nitrospinales bacterium]
MMRKSPGTNGKPANEPGNYELKDVDSFIRALKDKIQKVHDTVARLPKVDSKGHSECPFAERLYADKEELLKDFQSTRNQIPGYMNLIDQEIARFEKNLNQLQSSTTAFNTPQATQQMKSARQGYKFHYNNYANMKQELTELATQAAQVITQAKARQWPLGEPKKKENYSMAPMNTKGPVSSAPSIGNRMSMPLNTGPSAQSEVDHLLCLGHI